MTQSTLPTVRSSQAGRPQYSDAVRKKAIDGLRKGMTRRAAAGWAGIHFSTLYDWIDKDPAFAQDVDNAESFAEARYTGTITAVSAPSMPPAVRLRAAEFWLDRRRPNEWRERSSLEITLPRSVELARKEDLSDDDLRDRLLAVGEELVRRGRARGSRGPAGRDRDPERAE